VSEDLVPAELLSVFLVQRLWCWLRYGCPWFGELGFDRPTICNLVRKRETLYVPTLTDALVLKQETLYVPTLADALVLKQETLYVPTLADALVLKRETLYVPTLFDDLVLKRETLYVPTLSDDLVLKTMIDRVTLYQCICCLSVGA